jgi:SAM-dependent methyltransferase
MSYDAELIRTEFDALGLKEWQRLVATPLEEISLHIHSQILRRFAHPGQRVLEIGAGPGRFTQILAELGASVLVTDLSPVQVDLNRQMAREHAFAQAVESWQTLDVCDMSRFPDEAFDLVLVYGGPFSYVLERRHQALAECARVLKPGGILLASVMSLWGTMHWALKGVMLESAETNAKIIQTGDLSAETFPRGRGYMHLFRSAELREWLSAAGLTLEALSASRSLSTGWGEMALSWRADPALWHQLLQMELEASAAPGALDMGTHIIAAARKPA